MGLGCRLTETAYNSRFEGVLSGGAYPRCHFPLDTPSHLRERHGGMKATYEQLKEATEAGHLATARCLCEAILRQEPGHGPTLIRYADLLGDLALYDQAAAALARAEQVMPPQWQQFFLAQRGHYHRKRGDYPAAEREYLAAHALAPEDAGYLIYAAAAAFRAGDLPRAEEHARKATLCEEGSRAEAFFNLAGYLLAQQHYVEAHVFYNRAREIDPTYPGLSERLADLESALELEDSQEGSREE